MNKLFLGLAMIAGTLGYSQQTITQEKLPVKFGIKAGGNAASFSEQKLSINNQKIGFHAGAFVNIPLSQKFSLQPEVLYNQLGARSVISSTDVTIESTNIKTQHEYKASLNYISVPLMLQMKPSQNFYIEAGPEFSYFLNGKTTGDRTITTTTGGTTTTQTESHSDEFNKDNIKKFNVGLGLGLGYDFTPNLGINARYVNSLTHIANNSGIAEQDKNINTNRVFQLGLNYKF